jgi:lipoyl(octanoyl) transferase
MTALNFTNESMTARYLGLRLYDEVLASQKEISDTVRNTKDIQILGMEFHPVITLGIRGDQNSDLLQPPNEIPIPVVQTDRGGQATLHTPGQLVIYPTMDLKTYGIGVRDFVCVLTKATTSVLKTYGVDAFASDSPGVYTHKGKIGFLGIRMDRGVVRHGIAINIRNDVSVFNHIKSCGVSSAKLDRLQDYPAGENVDLQMFFHQWTKAFSQELQQVQDLSKNSNICDLQSAK